MIERQPARRAVALDDVEPGRAGHAGEIGHQRRLGDLHAVRMARAARRELDVAKLVRLPSGRRSTGFSGSASITSMPPCRRTRGKFLRRLGQEARQIVETDRRDRARGGELAAKLVEIGVLAADPDRDRDRHRQQAGILGAEEGVEEARPGVGRDQQPLAGGKARADQLAGRHMGALAHLFPGQGRKQLAACTIEGDAGLPLGRIVQHLRHRPEVGAAQGKLAVAGGKRVHEGDCLLAEGSGPRRSSVAVGSCTPALGKLVADPANPGRSVPEPRQRAGLFPFGGGLS